MDMSNIKSIVDNNVSRLPSEYQEVEYLESSGTQYIDTGVLPDDQTEGFTIKADYETLKDIGDPFQSIFGQTESSSSAEIGWFIYISRAMFIVGQSGKLATNLQTSINTGERHSYKLQFGKLIVDETSYIINKNTTYVYNYSISLFARAGAYKNGYSYSIGRMYSARIYDNINVVREFIPCYRKSDNKPGMYDLVTGAFYTNAGTGEFIVGSEVNTVRSIKKIQDANGNILWYKIPDGYRKVEYVNFTGTQYLNLQYDVNPNIDIWIREKNARIVNTGLETYTRCIIGARSAMQDGLFLWTTGEYRYGSTSGQPTSMKTNLQNALDNTDVHDIYIHNTGDVSVDDNVFSYSIKGNNFVQNTNILIGTAHSTGTTADSDNLDIRKFYGRVYGCTIKDNDILVRHLIPVVRNSDDKPGMYDLVNDVFYTNAGTGEFTYGG